MSVTTAMVREIRTELAKLKPVKITLDGNRNLTVKEAVFALAPILERMKKRGFDIQEIAEKLHAKGIEVKPPTLAKYLNEFRRGKNRKTDTPPPPAKTAPAPQPQKNKSSTTIAAPMEARAAGIEQREPTPESFAVRPDTPDDEL